MQREPVDPDSHWKEVMDLGRKYGFITRAYGGTAILMTQAVQKEAGIWEKVQWANGHREHL